jgi:hypothetical protein
MTRPKELRVSRSSKRTAANVAGRHRGRPSHVRGRALALEAAIASLYGVMLQIRDRNLLFHEACRILVQQGALPAVSICVIEEHSGTLAAVASAGNAQEPARAGRGGPRPARFAAAFPLLCDGAPVAILRVQFPGAGALRPAAFDLLERLARAGVDFVIVGGYAGVVHGCTYLTQDVDICCDFSARNLLALQRAIADLHPVHRMTPGRKARAASGSVSSSRSCIQSIQPSATPLTTILRGASSWARARMKLCTAPCAAA